MQSSVRLANQPKSLGRLEGAVASTGMSFWSHLRVAIDQVWFVWFAWFARGLRAVQGSDPSIRRKTKEKPLYAVGRVAHPTIPWLRVFFSHTIQQMMQHYLITFLQMELLGNLSKAAMPLLTQLSWDGRWMMREGGSACLVIKGHASAIPPCIYAST